MAVAILKSQLRGCLLEEVLACLMRHSGYELFVRASQDPDDLVMNRSELLQVRGWAPATKSTFSVSAEIAVAEGGDTDGGECGGDGEECDQRSGLEIGCG
jgi:hypothetical protein